jgi:hypothetical protein
MEAASHHPPVDAMDQIERAVGSPLVQTVLAVAMLSIGAVARLKRIAR